MFPQSQAIGHPAVPGAEIQNIQRALILFKLWEDPFLEVTVALSSDGPLFRMFAGKIAVGQRHIVAGIFGAAPFGVADFRILVQEARVALAALG